MSSLDVIDLGGLYQNSPPFFYALQTVIFLISAFVAWFTIKTNRQMADARAQLDREMADRRAELDRQLSNRRASLDLLFHLRVNREFEDAVRIINQMRRHRILPSSLFELVREEDEAKRQIAWKQFNACRYFLGTLELIAVGINAGALDDAVLKKYYYSSVIELHAYLHSYISEFRALAPKDIGQQKYVKPSTIFVETDALVERWKSKPLYKSIEENS